MNGSRPHATVNRLPDHWDRQADPAAWPWLDLAPLSPFLRADGRAPATQQTTVRLCHDGERLYVHFICEDSDIWGTYTERDDPIYDEEVVEVFLAPGNETPSVYAEFEVSPNGVLLDALITNPSGERVDMQSDFAWNCAGIAWQAKREDAQNRWSAILAAPLAALLPDDTASRVLPSRWRANFYRIERPRGGAPEFSCWSPTLTDPADFHKPAQFGALDLG